MSRLKTAASDAPLERPPPAGTKVDRIVAETRRLRRRVDALRFSAPVAMVYNPLVYAWAPHRAYLETWGMGFRRVVFLGMNPGPWGMAQTGVPFGEIGFVRDWLGIEAPVRRPVCEHPARPVRGFSAARSEVSGRRLWGLFRDRFGRPETFFAQHMVCNYCPLLFLKTDGGNLTPDRLAGDETAALFEICDEALRRRIACWRPEWVVGIGGFAADRAREALRGRAVRIAKILHPSPASPAANRGWAATATAQLVAQGVWTAAPNPALCG